MCKHSICIPLTFMKQAAISVKYLLQSLNRTQGALLPGQLIKTYCICRDASLYPYDQKCADHESLDECCYSGVNMHRLKETLIVNNVTVRH